MSELSEEGQAMTKAWKDTEQPEFKLRQFVEYDGKVYRICKINKHNFVWFDNDSFCSPGVHVSKLEAFTLRAGDYCKTEGMTEGEYCKIRKPQPDMEAFSPKGTLALCYSANEWFGYSILDALDFKRELTIEQILSTLPEEPIAFVNYGEVDGECVSEIITKPETPQIDWTKPIQTRDGREVIIYQQEEETVSVLIETDEPGVWNHESVDLNGRKRGEISLTVINVPEERKLEGFININEDGTSEMWWFRKDADVEASADRIACIDLGERNTTYFAGEGLE